MEFDHPHILLQRDESYFHQMVLQTGPQTTQHLKSLAKAAYIDKMDKNQEPTNDSSTVRMRKSTKDSDEVKIDEFHQDASVSFSGNVNYGFSEDVETSTHL